MISINTPPPNTGSTTPRTGPSKLSYLDIAVRKFCSSLKVLRPSFSISLSNLSPDPKKRLAQLQVFGARIRASMESDPCFFTAPPLPTQALVLDRINTLLMKLPLPQNQIEACTNSFLRGFLKKAILPTPASQKNPLEYQVNTIISIGNDTYRVVKLLRTEPFGCVYEAIQTIGPDRGKSFSVKVQDTGLSHPDNPGRAFIAVHQKELAENPLDAKSYNVGYSGNVLVTAIQMEDPSCSAKPTTTVQTFVSFLKSPQSYFSHPLFTPTPNPVDIAPKLKEFGEQVRESMELDPYFRTTSALIIQDRAMRQIHTLLASMRPTLSLKVFIECKESFLRGLLPIALLPTPSSQQNPLVYPKGSILTIGKDQYQIVKQLGVGSFGFVYEVTQTTGPDKGKSFAVKVQDTGLPFPKDPHRSSREFIAAHREGLFPSRLNGDPHVVQTYEVAYSGNVIVTRMEMVQPFDCAKPISLGGLLDDPIAGPENKKFLKENAFDIIAQLIQVCEKMQRFGFSHMDLHPGNVLISKDPAGNLCVKVADFGISCSSTEESLKSSCSPYAAFGIQTLEHPTHLTDLFGITLMMLELLGVSTTVLIYSPNGQSNLAAYQQVLRENDEILIPYFLKQVGPFAFEIFKEVVNGKICTFDDFLNALHKLPQRDSTSASTTDDF